MPQVGVRELKNRASEIIRAVREEKAEYIITYQGRPVGLLLPLDEEDWEDYLLTNHPHFIELREQAKEAIASGRYVTGEELRELLDAED